ncbi:hypothetical protein US8_01493 [Bacillus altitudinis]|uniref:hypothetical protein n=1 Tax=Bacillus altitudinis TaxID=293387 RepID=UPI000D7C3741|nr:hypothetical protein [Bacillus altitudinis]PYH23808.1 hypothetical protein US8_01493 [Bacillus altitudinis]
MSNLTVTKNSFEKVDGKKLFTLAILAMSAAGGIVETENSQKQQNSNNPYIKSYSFAYNNTKSASDLNQIDVKGLTAGIDYRKKQISINSEPSINYNSKSVLNPITISSDSPEVEGNGMTHSYDYDKVDKFIIDSGIDEIPYEPSEIKFDIKINPNFVEDNEYSYDVSKVEKVKVSDLDFS